MQINTYTLDQLAVLFQRSRGGLSEPLARLMDSHGFPRPLPCLDKLWSKPAVDRWFETNGGQDTPPAAAADPLDQRYGVAS